MVNITRAKVSNIYVFPIRPIVTLDHRKIKFMLLGKITSILDLQETDHSRLKMYDECIPLNMILERSTRSVLSKIEKVPRDIRRA